MADTYLSGCLAFRCTNAEMALLEEAFNAAEDLNCELEPPAPSQEFLKAFPPSGVDDPWSGFLTIFDDATFPILGADLTGGNSFEEPTVSTPMISGTIDFQPWLIAELVRRCCQTSLAKAPICFEWAVTCSRARPREFGGGRCVIFADRVDIQSTGEALRAALERPTASATLPAARPAPDPANRPQVGRSLLINAPEYFRDPAFKNWLGDAQPKFTWHRGGEPDEWVGCDRHGRSQPQRRRQRSGHTRAYLGSDCRCLPNSSRPRPGIIAALHGAPDQSREMISPPTHICANAGLW
jgi:hypothetical protein